MRSIAAIAVATAICLTACSTSHAWVRGKAPGTITITDMVGPNVTIGKDIRRIFDPEHIRGGHCVRIDRVRATLDQQGWQV